MKIITRMLLTISLFGLILLVTAGLLVVTYQRVERLVRQEEIARDIERTARELSYLSNDYLLNQEDQQRARWQSDFHALSADLDRLVLEDPRQRMLANQIKTNAGQLETVFSDIAAIIRSTRANSGGAQSGGTPLQASGEDRLAFIQVSWSRIEVQNQNIIFNAAQLSQNLQDQEAQLRQTSITLIIALAGIFGAYLLTNYFLIYRRTLRSLANLQAGVKIIGTGDLSYTIDDRREDEFGVLSRAFNQMSRHLREITASKADLEREINERQQVEKMLADYAEQLQRSNQELEQFAFIASHDLQEPVRKIRSFSNRLVEHLGENLEPEPRDYLQRMNNAAERMQRMINDLLELSRVGRRGEPLVRIALSEVVADVLSDLDPRVQAVHGRVEVSSLPELQADPVQMRQLLQNLIGNAIKYHKPELPPIVRVWSQNEPIQRGNYPMVTICVEDNGIGFEEEYLERIFQPFQRLHGRNEYEGTGIGLAICKKIVERHHGIITARSKPGEGTTFLVSLPVKQAEG